VVCLNCGEKWLSCCPKCGSEQFIIEREREREKQTCLFYDWIENKKRINIREINDNEWEVLWAEYVRVRGWI